MSEYLDEEKLEGPHPARIVVRPQRVAVPVISSELNEFQEFVELECQIWAGASNIALPLSEEREVSEVYRNKLPGSQIDYIDGLHGDGGIESDFNIERNSKRNVSRSQLVLGALDNLNRGEHCQVEVVDLEPDDPWRYIYQACLGTLPAEIDEDLIREGNWNRELGFSDFIDMQRVMCTGSLKDLLSRLYRSTGLITPRQMSMSHLSMANSSSAAMRMGPSIIPNAEYDRIDAGPNILVVCSECSVEDLSLLWNLRAAHGDFRAVPIGIPIEEMTRSAISEICNSPGLARDGITATSLYITSVSLSCDQLEEKIGEDIPGVKVCPYEKLVNFGTVLGWDRTEVLNWKSGIAKFCALDAPTYRNIRNMVNISSMLLLECDVAVLDSPFPNNSRYAIKAGYRSFRNGALSFCCAIGSADSVISLQWPTTLLAARSIAARRDLVLRESTPGTAVKIFTDSIGGLDNTSMFCHAPLLELLETLAAREGFGWYKNRLRSFGYEPEASECVGGTVDELPAVPFNKFKVALRNNDAATKYWLNWAERSNVIVKGFPIACEFCGSKQWVPVSAFNPPIMCRGCGREIEFPFGDRVNIDFRYRLSEKTRRIYAADAMGHLLTARFMKCILQSGNGGYLIGLHPGMSAVTPEKGVEVGEAYVLLFTQKGEFIPIEVKRSSTGLVENEIDKLNTLATSLNSTLSGVSACEYLSFMGEPLGKHIIKDELNIYRRFALSYDSMLDIHPFWKLGEDPFFLRVMDDDEIDEREGKFVQMMVRLSKDANQDMLTYYMVDNELNN
ncbi:hypothetical protein Csp1_15520 [Corynebacterium provencense]|uniref:Uncharacterized protein n=1 Tax=Corynebacterium provencense TaxID=1737425 RepID=A0A2Z3YWB3_9CORY|nr:hypothetical protein [Corynebacterium provencense]AWT26337.1 hypothetical protein Csp1_15520 [Corynebacterium provencense]